MKFKDWKLLELYVSEKLKELDPNSRPSKASGGSTELYDVQTKCDLGIECKQRATKSVTIDYKVWQKLCSEIPLHSERIPLLALENKDKKRWAVLDLDDFFNIYIELINSRLEN